MENQQQQPTDPTAAQVAGAVNVLHETVTTAFSSMGDAMLGVLENQRQAAETINQLVADRDRQLELVGKLTEHVTALAKRVETLTKIVDSDHAAVDVLMTVQGLNGKAANC